MRLFDSFDAVKFCEENLIFVAHNGYLYYIYDYKCNRWTKYRNAGNDHITVNNYPDVSKDEITAAMNGVFPKKETDFMRLCPPSQLWVSNMMALLEEDYMIYMSDNILFHTAYQFLLESDISYKSYLELKRLFDNAIKKQEDKGQVLIQIKNLSFLITGRDIFKKEIGIVDGHDSSSFFWIRPVRVIDYSNTNAIDNVAQMKGVEISIEEDDVAQYLTPFLYRHYDDKLEANKMRAEGRGFEWYLTHNFFTIDSVMDVLKDIKDTIDALTSGRENEFTAKLRDKRGTATYELLYARDLAKEQVEEYNDNRPKENHTEIELIIDFYHRFIYRMEYMLTIAKEKGYDLISFMGP